MKRHRKTVEDHAIDGTLTLTTPRTEAQKLIFALETAVKYVKKLDSADRALSYTRHPTLGLGWHVDTEYGRVFVPESAVSTS